MYFTEELSTAELEALVEQAEKRYRDCLAACVLAEGALIEARSALCREVLSDKRIYPHQAVWVRFKDKPSPVKMYYVGVESGFVVLRPYTPKGKLSTVIDKYGWKACYNMTRYED